MTWYVECKERYYKDEWASQRFLWFVSDDFLMDQYKALGITPLTKEQFKPILANISQWIENKEIGS